MKFLDEFEYRRLADYCEVLREGSDQKTESLATAVAVSMVPPPQWRSIKWFIENSPGKVPKPKPPIKSSALQHTAANSQVSLCSADGFG